MYRIAIAGFQHETNTFVTKPTTLAQFQVADSWPEMLQGSDVISGTRGMNLPVAGFIDACVCSGIAHPLPILWCAAEPSGKVTADTFDTITDMIVDRIKALGEIDAVYLDLHGAMVTDAFDDGDSEIIRRVRQTIGPNIPIGVSFDLHANISAEITDLVDAITIYKTYPHLDMVDTGARNFELLVAELNGAGFKLAFSPINCLIPLHAQNTATKPLSDIRAACDALETDGQVVEIALGFTASDTVHTGPSVIVSATSTQTATETARKVSQIFEQNKRLFDTTLFTPDDAIALWSANPETSLLCADVQDNPGAGASSDTVGFLRALVRSDVDRAVVGLICDPEFVAKASIAGIDGVFSAKLGGKSGIAGDTPLMGRYSVDLLKDGVCYNTGEMYRGCISELGQSVKVTCLDAQGSVTVIVTSNPIQCLDQAHFTYFDADLTTMQIIGVKSTLHYRADFEHLVDRVVSVASAGQFPCVLTPDSYSNLSESMTFL